MTCVRDIKRGDAFSAGGTLHWVATGDARQVGRCTEVSVAYIDGGRGIRQWDDPTLTIEVQRDDPRALYLLERIS